ASGWGYPSGHASQAVAAWGMIALLASWHAGPRARVLWWSLAAVVVTAVGASRVYLGVHWLTDVLGGATMIAAVLGLWAVVQLTVLTPHDRPSSAPADDRVRRPVT
ncbi:MAG: phosphatase PAP2 family protein, partial [Nocardioides sp.]